MNSVDLPPNIQQVIENGMSDVLHWFPEDVPVLKLAETMAGMANHLGGSIYLGVAPRTARIQGILRYPETLERIQQATLLCDPTLVIPIPILHPEEVIEIIIPSGLPNVYSLDGRYFGRDKAYTIPLPARKLRHLLVERGVMPFENRTPPEASLEDLDPNLVQEYLDKISLPTGTSHEEALFRRGCLRLESGKYIPTYAALLLFGKHPQQWLPNATLLVARFSGPDFSDIFIKQDITGNLPSQLRAAEGFIRNHLRKVVRMEGLEHKELPEYPFEAVRELLVNAVAHRDYNLQGDNIHLHIFFDKLEIHSPGTLPGPITISNLLQARFSRNPIIVQILSDLGFVERLGYGLNRVVRAMRQAGLRPPFFEEVGGSFRATLFNDDLGVPQPPPLLARLPGLETNHRQTLALNFIGQNLRITNREYQDLCPEVHPETLRRDLAELVEKGLLVKIGDKRATYYILKANRPR